MRIEPEPKICEKANFFTSSGKVIILELKLIKLPYINKKEYPEDYKFSLMACNKNDPQEFFRLDNHHDKPPHWHDNEQWEFFEWVSLEETWKFFYQKVQNKFGQILYKIENRIISYDRKNIYI